MGTGNGDKTVGVKRIPDGYLDTQCVCHALTIFSRKDILLMIS